MGMIYTTLTIKKKYWKTCTKKPHHCQLHVFHATENLRFNRGHQKRQSVSSDPKYAPHWVAPKHCPSPPAVPAPSPAHSPAALHSFHSVLPVTKCKQIIAQQLRLTLGPYMPVSGTGIQNEVWCWQTKLEQVSLVYNHMLCCLEMPSNPGNLQQCHLIHICHNSFLVNKHLHKSLVLLSISPVVT